MAWLLTGFLRFGGVIAVFAGVVLFGVYFIGGNARAAQAGDRDIPATSWRGIGPRRGLRIIAFGATMLLGAFVLGELIPIGN